MLRWRSAFVCSLTLASTSRQFLRFCLVGASGYLINLVVYATLLVAGLDYLAAATISFLTAAASNYIWNRLWTFQTRQARLFSQSLRAVAMSALSLGVNQLFLLMLVTAGAHHLPAQAVAILLVTPFSFAANKLWAFADSGSRTRVVANPSETGSSFAQPRRGAAHLTVALTDHGRRGEVRAEVSRPRTCSFAHA